MPYYPDGLWTETCFRPLVTKKFNIWRVGWAVESGGLENRWCESILGFESLTLRHKKWLVLAIFSFVWVGIPGILPVVTFVTFEPRYSTLLLCASTLVSKYIHFRSYRRIPNSPPQKMAYFSNFFFCPSWYSWHPASCNFRYIRTPVFDTSLVC